MCDPRGSSARHEGHRICELGGNSAPARPADHRGRRRRPGTGRCSTPGSSITTGPTTFSSERCATATAPVTAPVLVSSTTCRTSSCSPRPTGTTTSSAMCSPAPMPARCFEDPRVQWVQHAGDTHLVMTYTHLPSPRRPVADRRPPPGLGRRPLRARWRECPAARAARHPEQGRRRVHARRWTGRADPPHPPRHAPRGLRRPRPPVGRTGRLLGRARRRPCHPHAPHSVARGARDRRRRASREDRGWLPSVLPRTPGRRLVHDERRLAR